MLGALSSDVFLIWRWSYTTLPMVFYSRLVVVHLVTHHTCYTKCCDQTTQCVYLYVHRPCGLRTSELSNPLFYTLSSETCFRVLVPPLLDGLPDCVQLLLTCMTLGCRWLHGGPSSVLLEFSLAAWGLQSASGMMRMDSSQAAHAGIVAPQLHYTGNNPNPNPNPITL